MSSLSEIRARVEERKRKLAENDNGLPAKRWRTKGEIEAETYRENAAKVERLRLESNKPSRKDPEETDKPATTALKEKENVTVSQESSKKNAEEHAAGSHQQSEDDNGPPPLRKEEILRKLRSIGEPATLFGENDWDRFRRLRALELSRGDESRGQMNVFQSKLREMQRKDAVRNAYEYSGAVLPHQSNAPSSNGWKDGDVENINGSCPEDFVYSRIRRWVDLWDGDIRAMPVDERRTHQGRTAAATLEQTKEWLKPLVRKLRKRKLPANILRALVNIFEAVDEREYVRANSHYYEQLAIGNAPWPMGATMVGIHARAAREKIGEDKIAHVMNDEATRKYIQGIKRLVTLAQRHFPNVPSKMIQS